MSINVLTEGLNPLMLKSEHPEAEMDFYALKLTRDHEYSFCENMEIMLVLVQGDVDFKWNNRAETASRKSCFNDKPIMLDVSRGIRVKVSNRGGESIIAVMMADNDERFGAVFKSPDEFEPFIRGEGVANDIAKRQVCQINDMDDAYSKMFVGETVTSPGGWFTYPPHRHRQPEIYFYRFLPEDGFGLWCREEEGGVSHQNSCEVFADGCVHPQACAPGYVMYCLWVIHHTDGDRHTGNFAVEHEWVFNTPTQR